MAQNFEQVNAELQDLRDSFHSTASVIRTLTETLADFAKRLDALEAYLKTQGYTGTIPPTDDQPPK